MSAAAKLSRQYTDLLLSLDFCFEPSSIPLAFSPYDPGFAENRNSGQNDGSLIAALLCSPNTFISPITIIWDYRKDYP